MPEYEVPEYEVCNQIFDKCPGCGQYKGQYHDTECSYLEEERDDRDCKDSKQDKDVEGKQGETIESTVKVGI